MLFIYPNLVHMMKKHNLECQDIADILGIKYHAAYRRMRGLTGWRLHETIQLCQYFHVSDATWLFTRCDTYTTNLPENQDWG